MAMVVKNNMGATKTLNNLNKSSKKLEKAFSKVATGMKITGAEDDSAQYAISEKMREQIRSLDQDNQNVQNGTSLFKIAEGGIDSIVEELRCLKELAIKSANDTNTDGDRLTIQKEFDQRMANINDIATETNYNTKRLLDGTYRKMVVVGSHLEPRQRIVGYVQRDITLHNPSVTKIHHPDGRITLRQDNKYPDLVVNFSAVDSSISKQNNPRSPRGITANIGFDGGSWNWATAMQSTMTSGQTFSGSTPNTWNQVGISMNFTLPSGVTNSDLDGEGFSILCGGCYQYINITFDNTKDNADSVYTRSATDSQKSDYIIGVKDLSTIDNDSLSEAIFKGMDAAHKSSNYSYSFSRMDTYLNDSSGSSELASISVDSTHDVRIAVNPYYDSNDPSKGSKYIFLKENQPPMEFYSSGTILGTETPPEFDNLPPGKMNGNEETIIIRDRTTITIREAIYEYYDEEVKEYGPDGDVLKIHHGPKDNQATAFHLEDMHTKSLGTDQLFSDEEFVIDEWTGEERKLSDYERITNESDRARYEALSYDEDLQNAWVTTLKSAQNKTLDDIDVITKKNANIAIRVLDGAIDYALNEATAIGSYLQRLDFTGANIVTMNENVQGAESTIRDADMAKEMTEYTKYNVLQQAAQSMLAQANQNASAVLSLLQ